MRRLLALTALLFALPAATTAQAGVFPGDAIDGPGAPGAEIQSLGDLDLARDGSGGVAYVKRVDGVDAVFVARFTDGVFGPGERVDGGLPGPSSQPVVAASDGGRLAVVFVNAGIVYGVVRPGGTVGFQAPVPFAPGSDPSVDLSINGTAYASFTSAGDVRIARLDRRSNVWGLLDQPADVDPARVAGVGTARSRVAISADGVGVVTWGEGGHVYARKMFGTGLSALPQDLTPLTFDTRVATVSDLPDIDAEDDSSFAWVVFRQAFADGGPTRTLAMRQRGTAFDPPVAVDVGDEPAGEPNIDINGRGVGLATTTGALTGQPQVAAIDLRDAFGPAAGIFTPSVAAPGTVPAMSDNNDGLVASVIGAAGEAPAVHVFLYDNRAPTKQVVMSRPELGPVDAARGFDAAVDRASGGVVAWIQGTPDDRKLVAGYVDREPGTFAGFTSPKCCQPALARLSWQPSFGLWGPHRYQVRIDGQLVGETTDTKLQLTVPLLGAIHHWQVTAIDIRGQTRRSKTRLLRVDSAGPRVSVAYKRSKRVVTIRARARDLRGPGCRSSGIRSVTIDWGDGTAGAGGTASVRARHRYARSGSFVLTVTARDRAGNATTNQRTVVIG
jgi:hypothetical protein